MQVTQRHGVMGIALESLGPGFGPIPHEGFQGIHQQMKARSRSLSLAPAGGHWAAQPSTRRHCTNELNELFSLDILKKVFLSNFFFKPSLTAVTLQSFHPLL